MAKNKSIGKIVIPKEKIYEATKQRFNPHQGGSGAHKSPKDYSRKGKKDWKKYEY